MDGLELVGDTIENSTLPLFLWLFPSKKEVLPRKLARSCQRGLMRLFGPLR